MISLGGRKVALSTRSVKSLNEKQLSEVSGEVTMNDAPTNYEPFNSALDQTAHKHSHSTVWKRSRADNWAVSGSASWLEQSIKSLKVMVEGPVVA